MLQLLYTPFITKSRQKKQSIYIISYTQHSLTALRKNIVDNRGRLRCRTSHPLAPAAPPAVRGVHQVLTAHAFQVKMGRTQAALNAGTTVCGTLAVRAIHF
ncbi:hypothetical protein evm_010279 [Chilo suppressalis]|nr:hypothetical protein evm_010279 [Chilo suppressalis]